MTPARWMTLFGYVGVAVTVALTGFSDSAVGGGPGAGIVAVGVLRFGVTATLVVAILAVGFAVAEVQESPVRTLPHLATAGAATLVFLLLLVAAVRLWFF